ncbi:hypothetical protein ACFB49_20450 [Sphingomonas sp. DBB INV C78]
MRVVHDATAIAFDQWLFLLFPLAAVALTLWLWKTSKRRLYWKLAAGLAVFLALLMVALPIADHNRVQARALSGDVTTVEGPISGHKRWTERRWVGSSRGAGVGSYDRYDTTTYEYFYVGQTPFTFIAGAYPSQASFTNAVDPPVEIKDGMWAKASYFIDDWYDSERRITRLELGPPRPGAPGGMMLAAAPAGPPKVDGLPPDFAAFWIAFADAIAKEDQATVKALTQFPFQFGGHDLGADEFDSLWMSIFSVMQRPCLASARPAKEENRFTVFCGPYGYYFGKTATGWKLVEFGADGEDM